MKRYWGILFSLLLVSCSGTEKLARDQDRAEDPSLVLNGSWVALEVEGSPVQDPALAPTLEMKLSESSYSGSDGCNRFMGSLELWDAEKLVLGMAAATRMACPDMELADLFMDCLKRIDGYRSEEDRLHLYDGDDREILLMKRTN